jgi:AcrR family transcriptional regulator
VSPRPRKVSDDDVFAAAGRVMSRVGPAELTLAAIAEEAGVTAGALVQRFGSKRDLLVTMSRGLAEASGGLIAGLRRRARSPLAALRAFAVCYADLATSPDALARNLAYLQLDLTDPDLHAALLAQARTTRKGLAALVRDAIAAGELRRGTNPRALARLVETTITGSLMTWAIYREGTATAWLRRDVDTVLRPYRASGVARRTSDAG